MRAIAVVNQKGGVGKTTTAVNLAAGLVRARQRVLLIDLDPQAHASLHLGLELADGEASIYDVLVHGASVLEALHRHGDNLLVLPAHLDLVAAELELAQMPQRDTVLRRAVEPLLAEIDYCIVDCPPSLSLLAVNALGLTQHVLIPLQPHFLALQGLSRLLDTVAAVRQAHNPELRVAGVVFTMFDTGTRLAQEVVADVGQFLAAAPPDVPWYGARVLNARIRRNIKLAECPSFGQTIFEYAAGSNGAEDYAALADEVRTLLPPTPVIRTSSTPASALGLSEEPVLADVPAPAGDAAPLAESEPVAESALTAESAPAAELASAAGAAPIAPAVSV